MPTILPISDLRNYTEVLNRVDVNKPVYLTRNGRGSYVISKIDDYDSEATVEKLVAEIRKGEESFKNERVVSIDDIAKKHDIKL
jgi:PHD/YefM family antitoxin component YafN of YafNO toxin-antitoxin module